MRVLSVVHDPAVTGGGGLFERVVVDRGDHLDRWVVANGDVAPGDPGRWDALMVFGGAMHPDQDAEHPWLRSEVAFIRQALEQGVPTIGVCLGAQLIARAAGAWVGPAETGEVGWFTGRAERGRRGRIACSASSPSRIDAFQWHYYTFELPEPAVQLAASASARQAYRSGRSSVGHPVPRRGRPETCSTPGSSTARRSSPSRSPRSTAETDRYLETWNAQGRALCNAFLDEAGRLSP